MNQRAGTAWIALTAIISWAATARAQPCASCPSEAGEATVREPELELIPVRPPDGAPRDRDLKMQLAVGLGVVAVSYAFGIIVARAQPHSISVVDSVPIVGAVSSAARNPLDNQLTPALLISAGLQAMGLLVLVASGVELAQRARFRVDVGCNAAGGNVELTWRY
ncbi:MAG: hypothetical protein JWN44_3528 [Myxococcales bacterium]|nr:hypothetical protein [Myxococcales bacterium]